MATLMMFAYTNVISANQDDDTNQNLTMEEIALRAATTPVQPGIERSLLFPVQAFLNNADKRVEILFHQNIGDVCVEITNDLGIVVGMYECNSFMEPTIQMDAPRTAGHYTVQIFSGSFYGFGGFNIY